MLLSEGLLTFCERILDECSSRDEERDDTEEDAMALVR